MQLLCLELWLMVLALVASIAKVHRMYFIPELATQDQRMMSFNTSDNNLHSHMASDTAPQTQQGLMERGRTMMSRYGRATSRTSC